MRPQQSAGRTTHHGKNRGAGRGMSGGRWGRQMRNGYNLMRNPIRTIRCWNRSHADLWKQDGDQINLRTIKDSGAVVKQNYPQRCCRCCWAVLK